MGLTPQLTAALFCLLACTGNLVHGCNRSLTEIIQTLNTLSEKKTSCTELTVAEIFAVPKNTTEKELLCRATAVLRQMYNPQSKVTQCLTGHKDRDVLSRLKQLYRILHSMKNCPVNESMQTTLKNFLESLKRIMQKKYSQCGSLLS
uniref:Interleukin-4 n=1 Tax=Castor canadensis TaxID=51338 RepID=A0A8C0WXR0_CASCN